MALLFVATKNTLIVPTSSHELYYIWIFIDPKILEKWVDYNSGVGSFGIPNQNINTHKVQHSTILVSFQCTYWIGFKNIKKVEIFNRFSYLLMRECGNPKQKKKRFLNSKSNGDVM